MYKSITITKTMSMLDAGYSSLKVEKDAYIAHMRTLPYTVVTMSNGDTFAYGGMHAYTPCDTRHKIIGGIKKLVYGVPTVQLQQYKNYTACNACGCTTMALCHKLPKSHGGTPCVNNIVVGCGGCNGDESNQIIDEEIEKFLSSKKVTFSYTKMVKVK